MKSLEAALKILDRVLCNLQNPIPTPESPHTIIVNAEDLLEMAVLCDTVEGRPLDHSHLSFTLAGREPRIYQVPAAMGAFRSLAVNLAATISRLRAASVIAEPCIAECDLSQMMETLNVVYIDELDPSRRLGPNDLPAINRPKDPVAQLKYETQIKQASARDHLTAAQRYRSGVESLNPYGFVVTIQYLSNAGDKCVLRIEAENRRRKPLFFRISRVDPPAQDE